MKLTVNPGKVFLFLLSLIGLLVLAHLLGQASVHFLGHERLLGFVSMFQLHGELNIPSYFSGLLLACAAMLLMVISRYMFRSGDKERWHWAVLAGIFWFLSLDEMISIHEQYGNLFFSGEERRAMVVSAWVIPGLALVAGFGFVFLRFWWRRPKAIRRGMACSAILLVVGAIGFETACGLYVSYVGENFGHAILVAMEEGCEMLGVSLFIATLIHVIQFRVGEIDLKFVGPLRKAEPVIEARPTAVASG